MNPFEQKSATNNTLDGHEPRSVSRRSSSDEILQLETVFLNLSEPYYFYELTSAAAGDASERNHYFNLDDLKNNFGKYLKDCTIVETNRTKEAFASIAYYKKELNEAKEAFSQSAKRFFPKFARLPHWLAVVRSKSNSKSKSNMEPVFDDAQEAYLKKLVQAVRILLNVHRNLENDVDSLFGSILLNVVLTTEAETTNTVTVEERRVSNETLASASTVSVLPASPIGLVEDRRDSNETLQSVGTLADSPLFDLFEGEARFSLQSGIGIKKGKKLKRCHIELKPTTIVLRKKEHKIVKKSKPTAVQSKKIIEIELSSCCISFNNKLKSIELRCGTKPLFCKKKVNEKGFTVALSGKNVDKILTKLQKNVNFSIQFQIHSGNDTTAKTFDFGAVEKITKLYNSSENNTRCSCGVKNPTWFDCNQQQPLCGPCSGKRRALAGARVRSLLMDQYFLDENVRPVFKQAVSAK
jgi:hypothetical protein